MNPAESILINQRLDALHQRDEDARLAIVKLCERVTMLSKSIHRSTITPSRIARAGVGLSCIRPHRLKADHDHQSD